MFWSVQFRTNISMQNVIINNNKLIQLHQVVFTVCNLCQRYIQTIVQFLAFGSMYFVSINRDTNSVSWYPNLELCENHTLDFQHNRSMDTAKLAISAAYVLLGLKSAFHPSTIPSWMMAVSTMSRPASPTGHVATFFVVLICNERNTDNECGIAYTRGIYSISSFVGQIQ